MSSIDVDPSSNGRGSEAWSGSWTHFGVERRSAGYCRVTFDHPPINTITAMTVAELAEPLRELPENPSQGLARGYAAGDRDDKVLSDDMDAGAL